MVIGLYLGGWNWNSIHMLFALISEGLCLLVEGKKAYLLLWTVHGSLWNDKLALDGESLKV